MADSGNNQKKAAKIAKNSHGLWQHMSLQHYNPICTYIDIGVFIARCVTFTAGDVTALLTNENISVK